MPLEPYQERVIAEKQELDAKRERLAEFLASDALLALPTWEQYLLRTQSAVMRDYSEILGERIKGWPS